MKCSISMLPRIPESVAVPTTARSIPPDIMERVMAMDRSPTSANWKDMEVKFRRERKRPGTRIPIPRKLRHAIPNSLWSCEVLSSRLRAILNIRGHSPCTPGPKEALQGRQAYAGQDHEACDDPLPVAGDAHQDQAVGHD